LAGTPSADLEAYVTSTSSNLDLRFDSESTLTPSNNRKLQQLQPSHALLADIQEKSEFFDAAAAKYSPKVSS
jgi:coatomer protein complex subunit epsilon